MLRMCRAAAILALALAIGSRSAVVRRLEAAAGLSPRLGRFDLSPPGAGGDVVGTRSEAERLCATVGLRAASKPATLVETFLFQRESDMLAIKLRELHGVVDHFVAVESAYTFAGQPSVTWLRDGLLSGLGPWVNRSVHAVTLTEQPACDDVVGPMLGIEAPASVSGSSLSERGWRCRWAQEFYRRRVGLEFALEELGVGDDDVVVLTDADEVMSREAAGVLKHCDWGSPGGDGSPPGEVMPVMSMHYYGLDNHSPDMWIFGQAVFGSNLLKLGTEHMSTIRWLQNGPSSRTARSVFPLYAGGWHMSFFVSPSAAARKMQDSSHSELIRRRTSDRRRVEACMAAGLDAWGRPEAPPFVPAKAAADAQSMLPASEYLRVYGRSCVPMLMREYEGVFGDRRGWLPGRLRRDVSSEALSSLRAECLSSLV